MDRSARLHLVGKITYYIGWISLLCGGLVQLNIAKSVFMAMSLSKRNLFEISVACLHHLRGIGSSSRRPESKRRSRWR